jgi:hypothetical protein
MVVEPADRATAADELVGDRLAHRIAWLDREEQTCDSRSGFDPGETRCIVYTS